MTAPVLTPIEVTEATLDLQLTGMSCAACAARIEQQLNRVPGAHAEVNFALEQAHVQFDPRMAGPDELVHAVASLGYVAAPITTSSSASAEEVGAPADASRAVRRRLLGAVVLGVPVLAVSMVRPLQFDGWTWLIGALSTFIVIWGGWPFHRNAVLAARHRVFTMDTLVSLGSLAALLWSVWAVVVGGAGAAGYRMSMGWTLRQQTPHHGGSEIFFEVAVSIVAFLTIGRYLESRAKVQAGSALRQLLTFAPSAASILRKDLAGDDVETVEPISSLLPGMRFVVRPGERIATDGIIERGDSAVDRSLVTGESLPVDVAAGDGVTGGTVNVAGHLVVRATRVGADTDLARIGRLVSEAQQGKSEVQRLADRVAGVFVPVVLFIAATTAAAWLLLGHSADRALASAVAVVIVACPCALGLATPMALLVGTGRGAQLGLLLRGPAAIEQARRLDVVVLDKTGTLTTGRMEVVETLGRAVDASEVLALAAAVERGSEHPIAAAVVRAANAAAAPKAATHAAKVVDGFRALPGQGAEATVDGHRVRVGRLEGEPDEAWGDHVGRMQNAALTVVEVRRDDLPIGYIGVADTIRSTSVEAIVKFRALGLNPILLTGDSAVVAGEIARKVAISEVYANVLPEGKVAQVRALQRDGHRVVFVGDGVNDAAALAAADLGIAMGSGTDVAMEASDITLLRPDPRAAADAVRLARATLRTIRGNLFWAFAYNVAAIPLAAAGFLNPVIAAAAMAGSSLFVAANSLRLRRFA